LRIALAEGAERSTLRHAGIVLTNAFDREDDLDVLRGGAEIVVNAEVFGRESRAPLKAAAEAAPGVLAGADLRQFDFDFPGLAPQREVAGHAIAVFAQGLETGG